ncbi:MAG: 2-deoxystreptamine glucosyltransferase [Deltaproteobacteria bacterium ADurb.Bin151]|nr:MAG: 2-deoxystreptamine glucosyltransferase [Deltaproteobacteria bacterium ADurb.Bin151]
MVLRLEDMYPEVLVAAQIIKADSAVAKIISAVQKNIYKRSDRILVLGRQMTELVHGKTGNGIEKVSLITHWADCDEIKPLPRERNTLLNRLGILNKFVVQYSGNMGRTHDLESLVQCAQILEQHRDIHFLFIGSGAKESWLRKKVSGLGLKNITILSPQPRSELITLLNACDLAIISFVRGMAGASVPSRMYNIMSAGKPILAVAEEGSEIARVLLEENIGWVVAPGSPELIAKTILEANANRPWLQEMSVQACRVATEKYAKPIIMRKHRDLMDTYHV